jgi:hypothetical protein
MMMMMLSSLVGAAPTGILTKSRKNDKKKTLSDPFSCTDANQTKPKTNRLLSCPPDTDAPPSAMQLHRLLPI